MSKLEKYKNAFKDSLSIKDDDINEKLEYNSIPEWDSIGHMTLMSKLEEFAITQEQLDEVFENQEQIAVSKFYESLPKPWAIAMKELLNDELYMRDANASEDKDSNPDA